MKIKQEINCPVSDKRAEVHTVRLTALFVTAVTLAVMYSHNFYVALLLAADFAARAFFSGSMSPLKHLAKLIVRTIHIPPVYTNAAPKKFAALLGFVFSAVIALLQVLHVWFPAGAMSVLLMACAFIEAAFNVCVGCYLYTYLVLPFRR